MTRGAKATKSSATNNCKGSNEMDNAASPEGAASCAATTAGRRAAVVVGLHAGIAGRQRRRQGQDEPFRVRAATCNVGGGSVLPARPSCGLALNLHAERRRCRLRGRVQRRRRMLPRENGRNCGEACDPSRRARSPSRWTAREGGRLRVRDARSRRDRRRARRCRHLYVRLGVDPEVGNGPYPKRPGLRQSRFGLAALAGPHRVGCRAWRGISADAWGFAKCDKAPVCLQAPILGLKGPGAAFEMRTSQRKGVVLPSCSAQLM